MISSIIWIRFTPLASWMISRALIKLLVVSLSSMLLLGWLDLGDLLMEALLKSRGINLFYSLFGWLTLLSPPTMLGLELLLLPEPLELLHTCTLPELELGYSILIDSGSPIPLFRELPLLLLMVNMLLLEFFTFWRPGETVYF